MIINNYRNYNKKYHLEQIVSASNNPLHDEVIDTDCTLDYFAVGERGYFTSLCLTGDPFSVHTSMVRRIDISDDKKIIVITTAYSEYTFRMVEDLEEENEEEIQCED